MDIAELLAFSVKNSASDLHLSSGLPPMLRVHGGSVEPTNARRYATAADAHAGAAKYGSSKPHYRVYLCSAATRTPVED